jgi:hypothetical protein
VKLGTARLAASLEAVPDAKAERVVDGPETTARTRGPSRDCTAGTASREGCVVRGYGRAPELLGEDVEIAHANEHDQMCAGCERASAWAEDGEAERWGRRLNRESACWGRGAVGAEDCAAQPCLTSGISGERSESAACRG